MILVTVAVAMFWRWRLSSGAAFGGRLVSRLVASTLWRLTTPHLLQKLEYCGPPSVGPGYVPFGCVAPPGTGYLHYVCMDVYNPLNRYGGDPWRLWARLLLPVDLTPAETFREAAPLQTSKLVHPGFQLLHSDRQ